MRLQNTYLGEEKRIFQEDVIIPFNLYQKRSKKLFLKKEDEYYTQTNTLIKININNFLHQGRLLFNQKNYINDFSFFLRNPLVLIIRNEHEEKRLEFKIDQTPPIIKVVFPNGFFKSQNRYVTKQGELFLLVTDLGVGIKELSVILNERKISPAEPNGINVVIPLEELNNMLEVTSEDKFNNRSSKIYEIMLDNEPPKITLNLTEQNKAIVNYQESVYYFNDRLRVSFSIEDKYDQKSNLYLNKDLAKEDFELFQKKFLEINQSETIYYYGQDKMENTSPVKRISFVKKNKSVTAY